MRHLLILFSILLIASSAFGATPSEVLIVGIGKNVSYDGVDSATNTIQTIEYEHHEIHSGSSYSAKYENFCTDTGDRSAIAFTTPNTTRWLHIVASGSVTSVSRLYIIENPNIDDDEGTTLTIYNRNRNSANTSDVYSINNPAIEGSATYFDEVTSDTANLAGTTLDTLVIGAAGGTPARGGVGGLARSSQEWILKQNEDYVFMVESLDASDNYHTIELNWYEHRNK